jgi:excisionase family DNA binding protein
MDLIEQIENWGRALKVEELAHLLQISEKTIYRYISARKLPAFRQGGIMRLEAHRTAEWVRSRLS